MLLLTKETQSEREDRELPLPYQSRRVIYSYYVTASYPPASISLLTHLAHFARLDQSASQFSLCLLLHRRHDGTDRINRR
jgi:hypothetical protein